MSLTICPKCEKHISREPKECPNCGFSMAQYRIKQEKETFSVILKLIGALAVIGWILVQAVKLVIAFNTPHRTDASDACIYSESLVRTNLLKSPGSAQFLDCHDQKITQINSNQWQVSAYVDSQNSFGGLMRSYYTILVEEIGTDKWKLVDVKDFHQ